MGKTFSIPLFYVDTADNNAIKLDTGKTVTLREAPYSADLYTLSETVPGTSGIYKNDNVEDKLVRLFVGGSWKSDYGTFWTFGDAASNTLSNYIKKDGSVAMTGHLNMGTTQRIINCENPEDDQDAATKFYCDSNFLSLQNRLLIFSGNVLLVDYALASNVTGKRYNTIQGAIDYANSQSPSGTNRWTIYITPHKNNSNYTGYDEALTLYKQIDLIGLGKVMCKVSFSYSGTWTGGQFAKLQNLIVKPADDTSIILRGLECYNSVFSIKAENATPVLSLENSQFLSCGLFIQGRPDASISSADNNRLIQCFGNEDGQFGLNDVKCGGDFIDDDTFQFTTI
ncbi:MAG TPA: hypothetical protein VGK25_07415 [Ignavibacteria bacterium]|jgi:hypothetical protein